MTATTAERLNVIQHMLEVLFGDAPDQHPATDFERAFVNVNTATPSTNSPKSLAPDMGTDDSSSIIDELKRQLEDVRNKNTALEIANRELRNHIKPLELKNLELHDRLKGDNHTHPWDRYCGPTRKNPHDLSANQLVNKLRAELDDAEKRGGYQAFTTYADKSADWVINTWDKEAQTNVRERAFRFFEEALELVQAAGLSHSYVYGVLNYVYGRPTGNVRNEIGGSIITLALLAQSVGVPLGDAAKETLESCWAHRDKIKAKHAKKPRAIRAYFPEDEVKNA